MPLVSKQVVSGSARFDLLCVIIGFGNPHKQRVFESFIALRFGRYGNTEATMYFQIHKKKYNRITALHVQNLGKIPQFPITETFFIKKPK